MKRSGEFEWIARYFAPLAGQSSFGLRDDAALVQTNGPIVLTQDTIVEGIHFFPDDHAGDVARKAVRANVSDIVAKGAHPTELLLSLGVPDRWGDDDVAAFAEGLASDLKHYGLELLGGDTTRSPERLTISITMIGRPIREYVTRMGARPGDAIHLCGPIGDATLGLGNAGPIFEERQRVPEVRMEPAEWVAAHATASMDVSDGLVGDLAKLCAASEVRAEIDLAHMPISPEAEALNLSREQLIAMATGGDDYVVLMTAPRDVRGTTRIGQIMEGEGVGVTLDGVPVRIAKASYSHD